MVTLMKWLLDYLANLSRYRGTSLSIFPCPRLFRSYWPKINRGSRLVRVWRSFVLQPNFELTSLLRPTTRNPTNGCIETRSPRDSYRGPPSVLRVRWPCDGGHGDPVR